MLPSVFAPIIGVVVDRFDRRRVLVGGEIAQAVVAAVIVVTLPGLAPLLVLVFVKSIAASVGDIAGRRAIATGVDDNDLIAANSWFGGARQAADVVGPVLGGVFVAVASVWFALAVDLATFLLGVPLLLRLPALAPAAVERVSGWLTDARAGLAYIAAHPVAR